MTVGYEFLGLTLTVVLNFIALAYNAGRTAERLRGLGDALVVLERRFDGDLGRLNGKVDNDVQGRRAVSAMQQQLAEVDATLKHVADRVERIEELHLRRGEAA